MQCLAHKNGSRPDPSLSLSSLVPDTCDTVDAARVYLCDSGAQYKSGTTDVTRTVHFGTPTQEEKDSFTYVLKVNDVQEKTRRYGSN